MKKRSALTVAMLTAIGFGLGHPTRVLADDDQSNGWMRSEKRFVLDQVLTNGCNGEFVQIVGLGMIAVKTRISSDGTVQLKEHDEFIGRGTSSSGAEYVYNEGAHIDQSNGPNPD